MAVVFPGMCAKNSMDVLRKRYYNAHGFVT